MPELTDEEYNEYLRLKTMEAERQRKISKIAKTQLKDFESKRKSMMTQRSLATFYAKRLQQIYNHVKQEVFTLRWSKEKQYLTGKVLTNDDKGQLTFKQHFRMWMGKYGWKFRIFHNTGILEVTKCFPE